MNQSKKLLFPSFMTLCMISLSCFSNEEKTKSKDAPIDIKALQKNIMMCSMTYPRIETSKLPQLYEKVEVKEESRCGSVVASAQMWPMYSTLREGVLYELGIDPQSQEIRYIGTRDKNFQTPEGLTPKSTLEEVLKKASEPLFSEPGWAHWVELPSGWRAAFALFPDPNQPLKMREKPTSSTQVDFYFRR